METGKIWSKKKGTNIYLWNVQGWGLENTLINVKDYDGFFFGDKFLLEHR